jgi:hypothetical protein
MPLNGMFFGPKSNVIEIKNLRPPIDSEMDPLFGTLCGPEPGTQGSKCDPGLGTQLLPNYYWVLGSFEILWNFYSHKESTRCKAKYFFPFATKVSKIISHGLIKNYTCLLLYKQPVEKSSTTKLEREGIHKSKHRLF